jgi:hypothetical protein
MAYRNSLVYTIDSLRKNPDPNGYYLQDITWFEGRLKLFDDINLLKINEALERQKLDSIDNVISIKNLNERYQQAEFFILRFSLIWKKYPVTYALAVILFMILLLRPFIIRYKMMIKQPDAIDNLLEKKYIDIIKQSHDKLKHDLVNTDIVEKIRLFLEDKLIGEDKKNQFEHILKTIANYGDEFDDPAFKVKSKLDTRVFIEKGNLGRYLDK